MRRRAFQGRLLGLIEAYEAVCASVPDLARLRLPNFAIDPGLTRTLGRWDGGAPRLALCAMLFERHSWSDVVAVLKHEMAHQIVSELWGVRDESAHGPSFKRACAMLGIAPDASTRLSSDARVEQDPIARKIQKLLALGQSANPHEAERALAKAQELCLRYNVRLIEEQTAMTYDLRKVGPLYRRMPSHVWLVAGIVSDFYFVRYIAHAYHGRHSALRDGKQQQIELYGTATNLDMAEYVFEFLLREGEREWELLRVHDRSITGRRAKSSFLKGVYAGFRRKLEGERHILATEKALVWRGDADLDAFFAVRNPRVSHRTVRSLIHPGLHATGEVVGGRLQIRKPIRPGPSRRSGHLLE